MYQPARYYSPYDALEKTSNDTDNAFSVIAELQNGLKTFVQDLETGFANMMEFYGVLMVQIVQVCFHVGLPPRFDHLKLAYSANLFLAGIAPIIWYPSTHSKIVRSGILLVLKVAAGLLFIGTLLADVYLHKPEAADCTHVSFPMVSLSMFTAVVAVWVQLTTHKRKLGSSAILAIWLAVSILCDVFFLRDIFARSGHHSMEFRIALANTLSKALMLLLDEIPKYWLIQDDQLREDVIWDRTAGFWSRTVFIWLGKTFLFGFRSHVAASEKLDAEHRSAYLLAQFRHEWLQGAMDRKAPFALLNVCLHLNSLQFFLAVTARLSYVIFASMQIFFIRSFVAYISDGYKTDHDQQIASQLIVFGFSTYGGIFFSRVVYMKLESDLEFLFRGTIASVIHNKSLSLLPTTANEDMVKRLQENTVGCIVDSLETFQSFWAGIITIIITLGILFSMIGPLSFFTLLPTAFNIFSTKFVRKHLRAAQEQWSEQANVRTSNVSEMLSQIKSIKMTGLNTVVEDDIRKLHRNEISKLVKTGTWRTIHYAKAAIQGPATPAIIIFCALWRLNWTATPANTFAIFLTISMIENPSHFVWNLWSELTVAMESAKEVHDFLLITNLHRQHNKQLVRVEIDRKPQQPQPDNVVFQLRNAAIALLGRRKPVLRNVNVTVHRGDITMIAGPTSSGKSSILRSAIGEAQIVSGQRYKKHLSISYCGQRVWLQNKTIRQNILNGKPLDVLWYEVILEACQLKEDFQNMAKSDQTIISGNGSNLSGGQKHRITLARALYHKPSLLVLDNVFSSLDRQTAGAIFSRVFGPRGVVRQLNITVIMSAHTPQCLKFADKFIFIDTEGNTVQRVPDSGDVQHRIRTVFGNIPVNEDQGLVDPPDSVDASRAQDLVLAERETKREKDNLRRKSSWAPFLFYFRSFTFLQAVNVFVSMGLISMAEMSPGVYLLQWLEKTLPEGLSFASGYALFCTANVVFTAWSIIAVLLQVNPTAVYTLHGSMLQSILGSTMRFITSADNISILSLFAEDMASVSNELPMALLKTVYATGNVLATTAIIIYSVPDTLYLALVFIFILVCIQREYVRTMRVVRFSELETQAAVQTRLAETASGLEHIRAFGWRQQVLDETLACQDALQVASYHMKMNSRWMKLHLELITCIFGVCIVVATATSMVPVTAGRIGLALITVFALNIEMDMYVDCSSELALCLGAAARVQEFTDNTPQENIPQKQPILPKDWPGKGEVVFNEVQATYDPSTNTPVLKELSFTITPGQRVGIVGRTGSGKTSLLMTMLNFLDYTGTIKIDGIDISNVDPKILRASVTTVSQDFIEFNNTVRFNLCPWTMNVTTTEEGNAHEVSVIKLLEEFQLWPLVRRHGGLDAKMADLELSHGQKQLMCIIRACLHKLSSGSRLVIMDESTSELDVDMVDIVKNAMKVAFWDCTVITVAHRSQALEDVDTIMYMSNGKIVREKPKAKAAAPAPPQPTGMPQEPVAMTPLFEDLLRKSLQAEADVAAGLYNR